MALFESVPQTALAVAVLYVSWIIIKPFAIKSPLDNIPGPPRDSWINGRPRDIQCLLFMPSRVDRQLSAVLRSGLLGLPS